MKIAVSSDNHLDVNQVPVDTVLDLQADWLARHSIDYYLFAGDLFNDYLKTRDYFTHLQARVPQTHIYYILGNHDLLNHVTADQTEHATDPRYLHNRAVDLPGSDWRLIGNNGWYDYSFSSYYQQPAAVESWKKVYWLDSSIDQPESDQARMARVLQQTTVLLDQAQRDHKRVLFLTHFVPCQHLLAPKPAGIKTARMERVLQQTRTLLDSAQHDHKQVLFLTHFVPCQYLLALKPAGIKTARVERFYQMINAMLGSNRLGQLLESYPNVKAVFYGHVHGVHPPLDRANLTYFNQAVGVHKKRHDEWQAATFADQWKRTVRVIEL